MGAASAEDVASAVCREVALQLRGMRLVACARAEDDAALADAAVVHHGTLLGDAGTDQCSDERTRRAAGARTGNRTGERSRDHQADTRDDNRGGRREQRSEGGSDPHPCCTAHAGALGCLRAGLELSPGLHLAKVALTGLVRHDDADVVRLVPVLAREVVVRTTGLFGTVVQPGHQVAVARAAPIPRRLWLADRVVCILARAAGRAVGFVEHVVAGLSRTSFSIFELALALGTAVSGDRARGVFGRALGALAEG